MLMEIWVLGRMYWKIKRIWVLGRMYWKIKHSRGEENHLAQHWNRGCGGTGTRRFSESVWLFRPSTESDLNFGTNGFMFSLSLSFAHSHLTRESERHGITSQTLSRLAQATYFSNPCCCLAFALRYFCRLVVEEKKHSSYLLFQPFLLSRACFEILLQTRRRGKEVRKRAEHC